MDKNTVRGLVLIGLVFIVFMWLTPKQEEQQTQAQHKAETETVTEAQAELPAILSAQEIDWIKENITDNGIMRTLPSGSTAKALEGDGYSLVLAGDTLTGSIEAGGRMIDVSRVIAADTTLSISDRRAAVSRLNEIRTGVARFGRFAQFATGTAQTVLLQNDALAVTVSSKGPRWHGQNLKTTTPNTVPMKPKR